MEPQQQPNISITNGQQSGDHDLLLTIKAEMGTKLDRVISDVKDLNDNFAGRVADLENEMLTKEAFLTYCKDNAKEFEDYKTEVGKGFVDRENRLRFLERYAWLAIGAIGLLNIYLAYRQAFPH